MASETLPCGCVMDTVGDSFVYQPCAPDCEYWLYVKQRVKERDMKVITIVDPEIEGF